MEWRPLETVYNFTGSNWSIWDMNPDGNIVCSYTADAILEVDWRGRTTASYDFRLYLTENNLKKLKLIYNDPPADKPG